MKKSKLILAVAATVCVAASGALVACGNKDGGSFEITFNANGGSLAGGGTTTTLKTDDAGKLAELLGDPTHTDSTYKFNGWWTAETGGDKVDLTYVFTADSTIYAQWTVESTQSKPNDTIYHITFNAGDGEFKGGKKTDVYNTDTEGKLAYLPEDPTLDNADFIEWNTKEDGSGSYITESYVFSSDITVYAIYEIGGIGQNTYCISGETYGRLNKKFTDEDDETDTSEYGYYATGVDLKDGEVLTFMLNDKNAGSGTDVSFFIDRSSSGVEVTSISSEITNVKVLSSTKYDISIKWYPDGECFVLKITDGSTTGITMPEIFVEGAPVVMMQVGDGELIKLKTVAPTDLAKYTYTTQSGNIKLEKGDNVKFTIVTADEQLALAAEDDEEEEEEHIIIDPIEALNNALSMAGGSHGITLSGNTVTVSNSGDFSVFLRCYEGEKGALSWSVEMDDGIPEKLAVGTYYIVGSITGWTPREAYGLKLDEAASGDDGDVYSFDLYLTAKDGFKVTSVVAAGASFNIDWSDSVQRNYAHLSKYCKDLATTNTDSNIFVKEDGMYTVAVRIKDGVIDLSVAKTDDPSGKYHFPTAAEKPMDGEYYLVGSVIGWAIDTDYRLEDGTITLDLAAGEKIKIAGCKGGNINWDDQINGTSLDEGSAEFAESIADGPNNIQIKEKGKYTITITTEDGAIVLSIRKVVETGEPGDGGDVE